MTETRPLEEIIVRDRFRKEMGDIPALAALIEESGLLQPIAIKPDGTLIDGERRRRAFEHLGRTEIPVHVCETIQDELDYLCAQRNANDKLEMMPLEKVAMGKAIEALLKPGAEQRRKEALKRGRKTMAGIGSGESPEPPQGRVRDQVGGAIGWDGSTYQRAKKVVDAAEDESLPEEARKVAQEAMREMDETGKVEPAFQKARDAGAIPQGRKPSPQKLGDFGVRISIVVGACRSALEAGVPAGIPKEEAKKFRAELVGAASNVRKLQRELEAKCQL